MSSEDPLNDPYLKPPLTKRELNYGRGIKGATFDSGRIVVERVIAGDEHYGLWSGRQKKPVKRPVLISYNNMDYIKHRDHHDHWLRFDVPGISPLVFLGYRDGITAPDEEQMRRLRWHGRIPLMAVIEVRPEGERLSELAPLSIGEVIRLGLGLCDTLLALNGRPLLGLQHQVVFVAGEPGRRYYSGATPRSFQMLGSDGYAGIYSGEWIYPPTDSMYDRGVDEVIHTVAVLVWYALLKSFPFRVGPSCDDMNNTWNDVRAPFTGPPELGRLLEAVLISDVEKRMKAPELREELAKLAARWNIEPPPFPPPGLA